MMIGLKGMRLDFGWGSRAPIKVFAEAWDLKDGQWTKIARVTDVGLVVHPDSTPIQILEGYLEELGYPWSAIKPAVEYAAWMAPREQGLVFLDHLRRKRQEMRKKQEQVLLETETAQAGLMKGSRASVRNQKRCAMMTSSVCRVQSEFLTAFLADKGPGMHVIPETVLDPRQVRITDVKAAAETPALLKPHRGSMIPVIGRYTAAKLVDRKAATWEPQKALVYGIDAYIGDPDVANNAEELARATAAKANGDTTVLVAIVGESRSALAVCRNITSGCQKITMLVSDAEGAVGAANVYLVE